MAEVPPQLRTSQIRFCQVGIELQRKCDVAESLLLEGGVGGIIEESLGIRAGERGMGQRKVRIVPDRSLELLDRALPPNTPRRFHFGNATGGTLSPLQVPEAAQIRVIRLCATGCERRLGGG